MDVQCGENTTLDGYTVVEGRPLPWKFFKNITKLVVFPSTSYRKAQADYIYRGIKFANGSAGRVCVGEGYAQAWLMPP